MNANAAYNLAREQFEARGVDTETALDAMAAYPISIHCWQGDDVAGFENTGNELGGGIAVTGNYPGRARDGDELRRDAEQALTLIPGRHRFNLHAIYAETGGVTVERDELEPEHFSRWIDWAQHHRLGLDFNPTYFFHPRAAGGLTLSHPDPAVRDFWVAHGQACRRIGAVMGEATGLPCVINTWTPDGSKDLLFDRRGPRERLTESLDRITAEKLNPLHLLDAFESKLFGIGAESYTVGSHDFYLGYATSRQAMLCLDTGHFHPTEVVSDKLSSVLCWVPRVLLHVSRGVRWDSDHVVVLSDELRAIAQEVVRNDYAERVHIGLDFFDATINRVAAWVVGVRATQAALLEALLEPVDELRDAENSGDFTARLSLMEEHKLLPYGAVWSEYCRRHDRPAEGWLKAVCRYENEVLSQRV